jgi:hypothetical protein
MIGSKLDSGPLVPHSLTSREKWGRFWLAAFSLVVAAFCIYFFAHSLIKLLAGDQIHVTRDFLLPVSELALLFFLWTGETWVRRGAILFYGLRGGTYLWLVTMLATAMWASTPAEKAAAGRTVFLILLPGLLLLLLPAAKDWGLCALVAFVPSVRAFLDRQRYDQQGLADAMRDWWQKHEGEPQVNQCEIGEVGVRSGSLLIADPMYIGSPCRIAGLPSGRFPVVAQIIAYPEGSKRIAGVAIRFRPGVVTMRKPLGKIGVDSAMVIALDEQTYRDRWQEIGPERVGMTHSPNDNRRVAQLIEDKFHLRWRPLNGFQSMFLEPISEDLENQITDYLKTFPEYTDYPFMYFRVETNNTLDRIMDAMSDAAWSKVVLNDDPYEPESVIAISSGFGDGSYDLMGVYNGEELLAVEIIFIGPEQDRILEGFPLLRESPDSQKADR